MGNSNKNVFYIYCLSSLHCLLLKNTSAIVFIIYQVTVADFFLVVAMNIDILKQNLAKIHFKMRQIAPVVHFFQVSIPPYPLNRLTTSDA